MANAILNFHFDYLNPSLSNYLPRTKNLKAIPSKNTRTSKHFRNWHYIKTCPRGIFGTLWGLQNCQKKKRLKEGGEQNELLIIHNFQLLFGISQNCPTINRRRRRGQIALTKHFYTSKRQFAVRSERLEYSLELSKSFAFVNLGINKSNMECSILGFDIFDFAVWNPELWYI